MSDTLLGVDAKETGTAAAHGVEILDGQDGNPQDTSESL